MSASGARVTGPSYRAPARLGGAGRRRRMYPARSNWPRDRLPGEYGKLAGRRAAVVPALSL